VIVRRTAFFDYISKMKRILSLFLLFAALPSFALEPKKDSLDRRVYTDELGFFQKAERELNDPRFMFHDDAIDMDLGIGGTVGVKGTYTFAGSMYADAFKPAMINIPPYSNSFMVSPQSCELHAKARAKLFGHKIIAFVKFKGSSTNGFSVSMDQAYISFDGFSAGLVPSFFNDLESGVRTDAVNNPQSDVTNPLVGYTYRKNNWEAAISAEKAYISMDESFSKLGIYSNYQPMPDFVIHGKRRWNKGHVQLGAVFRNLTYLKTPLEDPTHDYPKGDGHTFGWGLSLSGNYVPFKALKFSCSLVGGQGISKYIDIFEPTGMDIAVVDVKSIEDSSAKEYTMKGVPMISASLMAQYWWMENLSSSFVLQYGHCFQNSFITNIDDLDKNLALALANIYWYMSDFAYVGLQYSFGYRDVNAIFPEMEGAEAPSNKGAAHRLSAVLKFMF